MGPRSRRPSQANFQNPDIATTGRPPNRHSSHGLHATVRKAGSPSPTSPACDTHNLRYTYAPPPERALPGFLLHVSYEDAGGFVVAEVWETQEPHDAWFDANVKPNVPGEITQEVIDLHSVHKP